jgi:hypothetical protein
MAQQRTHVLELFLLLCGLQFRVDGGAGGVAVEGGADLGGDGEDDGVFGLGRGG